MQIMYVSAEPGQPSTFWQGESGRWYTKKKLAMLDQDGTNVNPEDYEVKTSWWKRNGKAVTISTVVSLIIAIAIIINLKQK